MTGSRVFNMQEMAVMKTWLDSSYPKVFATISVEVQLLNNLTIQDMSYRIDIT